MNFIVFFNKNIFEFIYRIYGNYSTIKQTLSYKNMILEAIGVRQHIL